MREGGREEGREGGRCYMMEGVMKGRQGGMGEMLTYCFAVSQHRADGVIFMASDEKRR